MALIKSMYDLFLNRHLSFLNLLRPITPLPNQQALFTTKNPVNPVSSPQRPGSGRPMPRTPHFGPSVSVLIGPRTIWSSRRKPGRPNARS